MWAWSGRVTRIDYFKFVHRVCNLSSNYWVSLVKPELGLGWACKMVARCKLGLTCLYHILPLTWCGPSSVGPLELTARLFNNQI